MTCPGSALLSPYGGWDRLPDKDGQKRMEGFFTFKMQNHLLNSEKAA